uniref:hypothetical protein n=1 Tax=Pedobacter schmidteae TaxID=2201271 RepID=UPI000EB2589C|nr:hypothetical protein [Pedobacter schmidteae]
MEDNKKRVVKTIQYQTAVADKKSEKIYTVTVEFLEVSDEEARIKRGIIESILKKEYLQRKTDRSSEG